MSTRALFAGASTSGSSPAPAAFRYWRLYLLNNNGDGNYLCVAEVELRLTVGGADITTSSTPVTASSFLDALYPPSRIVDGGLSLANSWFSAVGQITNQWLLLDLSTAIAVKQVRISAETTNPTRAPKDLRIEGSSDGVNFTTVGTFLGNTSWGATPNRTFDL